MSDDIKEIPLKKPPKDPNDYRLIILPNGLTAVLIHTPNTPASDSPSANLRLVPQFRNRYRGAARPPRARRKRSTNNDELNIVVFVNGGSLNDPSNAQGLAHFLEHCVFFGSHEYPETDKILPHITRDSNAFTTNQWTAYIGRVPYSALDQFFPPFLGMLFAPTLDKTQADQEMHPLDDEFYKNLPYLRRNLVWYYASVNQDHPLKRLTWGSIQTLGNGDDNEPKLADHVHKAMEETQKAYYVPSAMTLAISSSKSLDEMEELVVKHFSNDDLPQGTHKISKDSPALEVPDLQTLLQSDRTKQYISTPGLGCDRDLSLLWHIPPKECGASNEYVLLFVASLLEDTSPKGLFQTLRDKDLVQTLNIAIPHWINAENPFTSALEVSCRLTESGKGQVPQIIDLILEYIEFLLKDVCEQEMARFFEEIKVQQMNDFNYPNMEKDPLERCEEVARWAQMKGAVPDLLYTESWYNAEFNFERIQGLLSYLLKQEYLTIVDTLEKDADFTIVPGTIRVEPYSKAPFKENTRIQWESRRRQDSGSGDGTTIPSSPFSFVPANHYLELDLFTWRNQGRLIKPKLVDQITGGVVELKYANMTAYHKGHSHNSPAPHIAHASVKFSWPYNPQSSANDEMLSWLWINCVEQHVQQFQSEVSNAGYLIDYKKSFGCVVFKVSGKSRDIIDVMKRVLEFPFCTGVTEKCIMHAKAHFRTLLTRAVPLKYHLHAFKGTARNDAPSSPRETLESLRQFQAKLMMTGHCKITLKGNVALSGCRKIARHISRLVPGLVARRHEANAATITRRENIFPEGIGGEHCYRVKFLHSEEYRTIVTNEYTLLGQDPECEHYFNMAMGFMDGLAFRDLRSRQLLGYGVNTLVIETEREEDLGFSIIVEATGSKYTACEINKKIDQFCADLPDLFRDIFDDVFNTKRSQLSVPATVTKEDVADWWEENFPCTFGVQQVFEKCKNGNIQKMTYQHLSGNPDLNLKPCCCDICSNFTWSENSLTDTQFAEGQGVYADYFVNSPPED